ncbi:MAG: YggU family protein [Succinivibrionaceae bacterium]|nr:YggU family protein [Succinivibrionaceae bacterium]
MTDILLNIAVQPKSSRDAFAGWLGDEIKIAITAPPVDGKANDHLKKFLAKQFRTAPSNVEIIKGLTGRHKTVKISGARAEPDEYRKLMEERK